MPYVGVVTPGVAARARNPSWNPNVTVSKAGVLGEWDIIVPNVKQGGVGS